MDLLYVTGRKPQKRVVVLMDARPVRGGNAGETENRGRTGEEQLKSSGVRFVRDGELLPWNLAENLTARRAKGGVLEEALRLRDKSTPQTHRQANMRRNNRSASTRIEERVDRIN